MIPVSKPWITNLEKKYVEEAMDSGWISSTGKFVQKFEDLFSSFVGVRHSVAVINGTSACHLALLSVGIGPGNEVIVPATTFVATANAVKYCGATVKVVDISRNTWNMDFNKIILSDKTKAIFFVHLYGNMCDMDALNRNRGNTILVEDACEAFGGEWKGKRAGSLASVSAFSFYANKTISTGEGGMICCDDDEIYDKVCLLKGQGQTSRYYHPIVGYNYRMTNVQAAIGLAQIERVNEIMLEKKRVYDRYKSKLPISMFAKETCESKASFWAVTILSKNPVKLSLVLSKKGIDSRRVFYPISDLPPYFNCSDSPNAKWLRKSGLTLPSYCELSNAEIDMICDLVNSTEENKED